MQETMVDRRRPASNEKLCSPQQEPFVTTRSTRRKVRIGFQNVVLVLTAAIGSNLCGRMIQNRSGTPDWFCFITVDLFARIALRLSNSGYDFAPLQELGQSCLISSLFAASLSSHREVEAKLPNKDHVETSSPARAGQESARHNVDNYVMDRTNDSSGFQATTDNEMELDDHHQQTSTNDVGSIDHGGDGLQPLGHHLLIDLYPLDGATHLDAEKLTDAVFRLVAKTTQTTNSVVWSKRCSIVESSTATSNSGVTCTFLFPKFQIAIQTWARQGLVSLSLFTTTSREAHNLLSMLPEIRVAFGIPPANDKVSADLIVVVDTQWTFKKRGYRFFSPGNGHASMRAPLNRDSSDSERCAIGLPAYLPKAVIAEFHSKYQKVELHEFAHHGWFATTPPMAQSHSLKRNKKIFLDGVLQSTLHGLEPYHEALVQPALLAHPNPKRVAIIGGGEGATLREVLKHKTVETCVMVEIDAEFIQFGKEYMPEWNDCSDFIVPSQQRDGTKSGSCFDDPRTELYMEDAVAWFIDRYGDKDNISREDQFDVVIMDALDPSSAVEFSDVLYADERFVGSIMNSIADGGMLVVQTGEADDEVNEFERASIDIFINFENIVKSHGAISWKSYVEEHGQFNWPWEFGVAFKGIESKTNFYSNPAIIDMHLAKRAIATKSGTNSFRYFDGASMSSYQYPTRTIERDFCMSRSGQFCNLPRGFDPDVHNVAVWNNASDRSLTRVGTCSSNCNDHIDERVHSILIMPKVKFAIQQMLASDASTRWELFSSFLRHSFLHDYYGDEAFLVDPWAFALDGSKVTNDSNQVQLAHSSKNSLFFDPSLDRNHLTAQVALHPVVGEDDEEEEMAYYSPLTAV
ncbi:hypothetical protein ACA910_009942 [Epithemia clementina (nom. ined.)]